MSVELHQDPETGVISTPWGVMTHPTPAKIPGHPGEVVVGHVCLIDADVVAEMLATGGTGWGSASGVPDSVRDCIVGATTDGTRMFLNVAAQNGTWVWELHPAHWSDGGGPDGLMVGVWRD